MSTTELPQVLPPEQMEAFQRALNPPPGGLTPRRMVELDLLHAQRVFARDHDAIKRESLVDEPVYELFPQAIKVTGIDGVRALHSSSILSDKKLRDEQNVQIRSICFGHNVMTLEWSRSILFPDGTRKECYGVAVIPFEGEKLIGERVYTDRYLGDLQMQKRADLLERPDVTSL